MACKVVTLDGNGWMTVAPRLPRDLRSRASMDYTLNFGKKNASVGDRTQDLRISLTQVPRFMVCMIGVSRIYFGDLRAAECAAVGFPNRTLRHTNCNCWHNC